MLVCLLSLCASVSAPAQAQTEMAAGGHFGLNLDGGHPILGADLLIELKQLSSRVTMGLWPAYSHVFIEDAHDVDLLEVDLPFLIRVRNPNIVPYVSPGLGLSFSGGSTLKLNLIGGVLFRVGERIEPFTQLAVRMIQGTYVDLLGGVVVRF